MRKPRLFSWNFTLNIGDRIWTMVSFFCVAGLFLWEISFVGGALNGGLLSPLGAQPSLEEEWGECRCTSYWNLSPETAPFVLTPIDFFYNFAMQNGRKLPWELHHRYAVEKCLLEKRIIIISVALARFGGWKAVESDGAALSRINLHICVPSAELSEFIWG